MTISLTTENVLDLLEKAVEDRGIDYVYPNDQKDPNEYGKEQSVCRYVFRGPRGELQGPGCILGHVLATAGVPVKVMAPYDVASNGQTTPGVDLLRNLFQQGLIEYDHNVDTMLEAAQSTQDNGSTWGEAYNSARHVVDRLEDH